MFGDDLRRPIGERNLRGRASRAAFSLCVTLSGFVSAHLARGAESIQAPAVWIDLCSGVELGPSVLPAVKREVETIYASGGVVLRWTTPCSGNAVSAPDGPSVGVYVVSELPASIRFRFQHFHHKSGVIAYTLPGTEELASPVIYVSMEQLMRTASRHGELTREQVSRALGRVTAHELAHWFLQERHAPSGILKASFCHRELVGEEALQPFFTPEQTHRLRVTAARISSEYQERVARGGVDGERDGKGPVKIAGGPHER